MARGPKRAPGRLVVLMSKGAPTMATSGRQVSSCSGSVRNGRWAKVARPACGRWSCCSGRGGRWRWGSGSATSRLRVELVEERVHVVVLTADQPEQLLVVLVAPGQDALDRVAIDGDLGVAVVDRGDDRHLDLPLAR